MYVRTLVGAHCAYALIDSEQLTLSVQLAAGKSPAKSLRETAEEWREKAARLQYRAMLLDEAADQLDAPA